METLQKVNARALGVEAGRLAATERAREAWRCTPCVVLWATTVTTAMSLLMGGVASQRDAARG